MKTVLPALGLAAGLAAPVQASELRLIWSDEFEGQSLDREKWTPADDCWGGGNSERQCYKPANVTVAGGFLRLSARREEVSGPALPAYRRPTSEIVSRAYSSGRVDTRGLASFMFGRIEVRAKLPAGQGLWSAIWMLPEHDNYGPYPLSGEIDIAEVVNLGVRCLFCRDEVHGALHHGPSLNLNRQFSASARLNAPAEFHVFALDWTPTTMTWLVDGRPYHRRATHRPFDQRFHLILNLAVGGRWPETTGRGGVDDQALPAEMLVDWVRVYGR